MGSRKERSMSLWSLNRGSFAVRSVFRVFGALALVGCAPEMPGDEDAAQAAQPLTDYGTFDTTYYPYGNENWSNTACGSTAEYGGFFLAVTEQSPLWPGRCSDGWASCDANPKCRDNWSRIPEFFRGQRIKDPSTRRVLEPYCGMGSVCGKPVEVSRGGRVVPAFVWDACPSLHWNNVLAEVTTGRNPCAAGARHVDLYRDLYVALGGDFRSNLGDVRITDAGYSSPKPPNPPTTPSGSTSRDGRCWNYCPSASADPDRDGWGWANNASCIVRDSGIDTRKPCGTTTPPKPPPAQGTRIDGRCWSYCPSASADPDRDGWGWANNASCIVRGSRADTRVACSVAR
jgi:hypothetical protein